MMNFNGYTFGLLLGFVLIWASCSDSFLESIPDNASSIEEQLSTAADARIYMNGAYDALSSGNVYGGQFALISELMADGIGETDLNGDWFAHYTRTTDIFLGTTRTMMHDSFKAVARANNVLGQLDRISDLTNDERQIIEGEIRFIRALVHFDAVRFFAQPYGYTADNSHLGIVVRTSYSTDLLNRGTVAEAYAQVIEDLEAAAELLPENNGNYANSYAAKALLARVYFQMNDFQNAFDYANDVILNSGATLDTLAQAKFGYAPTNEVLFRLVSTDINADNSNGSIRGYFFVGAGVTIPGVRVSNDVFNAATFEPLDRRGLEWFSSVSGVNFCSKFSLDEVYDNPVIHLTEMYLIRAEAAVELGDNEQGVMDINEIRERVNRAPLSPSSASNQIIQTIRGERMIEMYFENNRLHELKRQALRDSPNLLIRGAPWDCAGLVCQIPDNELKGNPNMEPNPQGGCN